jgi:outer membrane protein assembly factor BamB
VHARCLVAKDRIYLVREDRILAVDWNTFRTAALKNPQLKWRRWEKTTSPRYGTRPYGLGRAGQLVQEDQLLAEDIEETKVWSAPNSDHFAAAILAGRMLILGGRNLVAMLDARTGDRLASYPVEGEARGLAVADTALFVSTDRGNLYCFRPGANRLHAANPPPGKGDPLIDLTLQATADTLLGHADTRKGICLMLGGDDIRLAVAMARQSEFYIVIAEPLATKVAAARKQLTQAGLYGTRIVVHHVAHEEPSYAPCFANLILSQELLANTRLPYRPSSLLRLLQPYGGTIALLSPDGADPDRAWRGQELDRWSTVRDESGREWKIARRGPLQGAGQWTHMYADPANTVCSGDRLVGAEFALQWFGPPGAEDVVERHAVAMPSLFKDGKLFVAGLFNSISCVDAYNGTLVWKRTVPESTRMMLSHNAGFMAAGDNLLFVAADAECWALDANTGTVRHKFQGVKPDYDWGYVATIGNLLLGSDQQAPADEYSYGKRKGGYRFLTSAKDLHSRPTISQNLFAHDLATHQRVWLYEGPSAILNSTITVGGNQLFFAESRAPDVLADETGTAWLPSFFAQDARLVALDLASGRELWSRPLAPLSGMPGDQHEHIMFLSYAKGMLLATRTGHVEQKLSYRLEALDAATGKTSWQQTLRSRMRVYAPLTYGKNGQQSHPSIVGDKVFLLSHITDALITLDLHTGHIERDPDFFNFWIHSKTCAVPTASASGLYFRRDSCYMFDLPSWQAVDLTAVTRPGCWMSIIPAGGLVLMPEASSGCTCGFSLQTSVVLAPAR